MDGCDRYCTDVQDVLGLCLVFGFGKAVVIMVRRKPAKGLMTNKINHER